MLKNFMQAYNEFSPLPSPLLFLLFGFLFYAFCILEKNFVSSPTLPFWSYPSKLYSKNSCTDCILYLEFITTYLQKYFITTLSH